MAKKQVTADSILTAYMQHILEHGKRPKNVFLFAKELKISEQEFYQYYANFEILEQEVFTTFFTNTLELLHKNKDYEAFDAKNKLLSFYFTFFEIMNRNRSYIIHELGKEKMESMKTIAPLRKHFKDFIDDLEIDSVDFVQENLNRIKAKSLSEIAWAQLLFTIKFWKEDTSPGFEKTDVFIEKSINTTVDLVASKPFEGLIDLGKFLFKEKMSM
ncbi:MAG: TetR family transcriptional regulator C-terminal domain-containing protein [Salibacteraceae bacterium]|nr:TetR family transcriptional regulator C-terminal domain-containing protein [Salibacteraceae bacterium]|tara:strand:- start:34281 stop:34925 length:645 start_codon:yes stop_codon:yes gene_type:complete